MDDLSKLMLERWQQFLPLVNELMRSTSFTLGEATPPNESGVYMLYDEEEMVRYVGKATGSSGLQDRLLRKHVSGDESHAIQRAYVKRFPDRSKRRIFIKEKVRAKWITIPIQLWSLTWSDCLFGYFNRHGIVNRILNRFHYDRTRQRSDFNSSITCDIWLRLQKRYVAWRSFL